MRIPQILVLSVLCCIGLMPGMQAARAQTGPGACCLSDGTCVRVTPATCASLGGTFIGSGTFCSDVQCSAPTGACCFPDGTCTMMTNAACGSAGGTWAGAAISCDDAACPQPVGACCFSDGTCTMVTHAACGSAGGTWSGAAISCVDAACPQPIGACCFPKGTCSMQSESACEAGGGIWLGAGVSCASAPCPEPVGACCFPQGACKVSTASACVHAGGTWTGAGVSCMAANCPKELGPCCLPDGTCIEVTQQVCSGQGGFWSRTTQSCTSVNCPQPTGACCFGDGSCAVMTGAACSSAGGTWSGAGVTCGAAACPQPTGACCFGDGSCAVMTGAACSSAGGTWSGAETICSTADCPQPALPCCLPDGSCIMAEAAVCAESGGVSMTEIETCGEAACKGSPEEPPPPPDPLPRRASAGIKGSVLVLPSFEVRWDRNGHIVRDTFVSLTNDFPADVDVLMYFVNGDAPIIGDDQAILHPGWNFVDNQIRLTANEPAWWSVATGMPKGVSPIMVLDPGAVGSDAPGRPVPGSDHLTMLRGYIVAVAVHPEGHMIRWNHLSAVVTTVDYSERSAFEYAPLAFPVIDPSIEHGGMVGVPGDVQLDGQSYAFGYELLLMNFQAAGSSAFSGSELVTSDGRIIIMPLDLDLRFGTSDPARTFVKIDVWNENEVKFSGMGRCVTCWDSELLSAYGVPNHFLAGNLLTDSGKARMAGISSPACVGSSPASLAGIFVRSLDFSDRGRDRTASLLTGMGMKAARIRFDPLLPPPEAPSEGDPGVTRFLWTNLVPETAAKR